MTTRMILSDTDIINFSNQLNDSRFFIRPEYTKEIESQISEFRIHNVKIWK